MEDAFALLREQVCSRLVGWKVKSGPVLAAFYNARLNIRRG